MTKKHHPPKPPTPVKDLRVLRAPGSGTGGGGGGQRRQPGGRNIPCTADCGGELLNPTGPGVAFIRIRRQRIITLCPECTAKALAAVGIQIAPEPAPTPAPPTSGGETQTITSADVGTLTL